MAELQCKICGKPLDISDKDLTSTHSCGAELVLPSNLTEERIEKFNTGYKYLRTLDFKKAFSVFNEILMMNEKKDYEAHWCLALCEFKIEYHLNTVSKKLEIHTHYSGNDIFTESEHYKIAIKNSQAKVKKIYAEIGTKIDEIISAKKISNNKRHEAYKLLSESKFEEAEKMFNDITENSAREPMAYIGKLLCELEFTEVSQLSDSEISLTQFKNYNNAIQCADRETKIFLNSYNMAVSERLNQEVLMPDDDVIHTLDEMEISAEDTFDVTTTDKLIGALRVIQRLRYSAAMYFREHLSLVKSLLITLCVLVVLGGVGVTLSLTVFSPTDYYKVGTETLKSGNIAKAAENFALAKDNPKAVELMKSEQFYSEIKRLYDSGKTRDAIHLANLCGITKTDNAQLNMLINEAVSSGENHSLVITKNNTVAAVNTSKLSNHGECNVTSWSDVISVSVGTFHSVGLTSDGTVLTAGDNRFGQCNVNEWENIIAISAGGRHTVGLKSDGTVVATEYLGKNPNGQCDVSSWKNVIAISAANDYTAALLSDGKVVSTKQIDGIEKWTDIVAISAGTNNLLALTDDGKVLSAKINGASDFGQNNCSGWSDIVKISAGNQHSLALQADGKLLSTVHKGSNKTGQDSVAGWSKIIAFSAGIDSSVALNEKYQFVSTSKANTSNQTYQ